MQSDERVAGAIDDILALVERAAGSVERAALRLVTGLAEGTDAIGADVALARGWRLDAVLPFPRVDYASDFPAGPPRDAFIERMARCTAVMELPGDRTAPDGEEVAYERAGRTLHGQCDLLIAVWDGKPARGRGGTPQIVAEAVLLGIPVIHIDPAGECPILLWDGLDERDLGPPSLETVRHRKVSEVAELVRTMIEAPADSRADIALARLEQEEPRRQRTMAIAYPLLLAIMGIRRLRTSDFIGRDPEEGSIAIHGICSSDHAFAAQVRARLAPQFMRADLIATRVAQLFRSVYVTNFTFAAAAVVLSLLGLALPLSFKPLLIALEIGAIATILLQTRIGRRQAWHQSWLNNRALAERLRCLVISSQLGDLNLRVDEGRSSNWVTWYAQRSARALGLPSVAVDDAYLACLRTDLLALIDGQVAYLTGDARRMHRLEHRLHLLGTWLFALTAIACVGLLLFKMAAAVIVGLHPLVPKLAVTSTILGAALPAIGAAIYGIRMQGDFAGTAERSHQLDHQLAKLRAAIVDDELTFDTLMRRNRRVTELLTADLATWLQTYHARPLALPG